MRSQGTSRRILLASAQAAAAACISVALLMPANAQFWGSWGQPQRPAPQQRQPQGYNPFGGGFFGNTAPQREAPADYSHAPGPQKKAEPGPNAITVLVLGDSMADWLAYGLEDAYSEQADIAILRRHRTYSGLIRYDTRRDVEWAQVVKENIAADKPKYIVMMIGVHDRQAIRERASAAPAARQNAGKQEHPEEPAANDPELQARQSADQQNAEQREKPAEPPAPEPPRGAAASAGPFEFRSEKWEAAYIKRIDATIAAMKSAGVPVFWVGLPPQRANRPSTDSVYLNELYRQRAEKAGIVYVDVWDGFVDANGSYTPQGPDFEGQIRRLRSSDGVYFTKAGARKLAHYVEREIQRSVVNRALPVALPATPEPAPAATAARPGGSAGRPLAGPVVPLTVSTGGPAELLGTGPARATPGADPVATRVLTRGEALPAPSGRADDFNWPRNSETIADPPPVMVSTPPGTTQAKGAAAGKAGEAKQHPLQKRQSNPRDTAPRPPGAIRPSASINQGGVR